MKLESVLSKKQQNPLGYAPVGKLMAKFAIPSIIGMLVSALYNIVDQLFIGHAVGTLGNAATNIAFPLTSCCVAAALLFGIGGAASFNLALGKGEKDKAGYYMGNALSTLVIAGVLIMTITSIFLKPLLIGFGSPTDVLPLAMTYVRITAFGFPFMILTAGGGHLVRADGSPKMAMMCNLTGAAINTVLDALFVLGFQWGMAGAAIATVIGQVVSAIIVIVYMRKPKTITFQMDHFLPRSQYVGIIAKIGMASCINQLAMMVVQIVLNNSLKYYGALSEYGEAIPIACAGIIMKVSMLSFSIVIGLAQGSQPIESFNYGARQYDRVHKAFRIAIVIGFAISVIAFLLFQFAPRQIIALFGSGSEEYFVFASKFFRIFLFFTWLNFVQPIISTFFSAIGKSGKGVFTSLTRQIMFLVPLILILPLKFGLEGILYAAPISDAISATLAIVLAIREFQLMGKE